MKGKSYAQMEYCHNIIVQNENNYLEKIEYSYSMAQMIARLMDDYNERITMNGFSFVQQYMIKQGLKIFGEKGKKAASKEVDQLHRRNCFTPISVKEMTD